MLRCYFQVEFPSGFLSLGLFQFSVKISTSHSSQDFPFFVFTVELNTQIYLYIIFLCAFPLITRLKPKTKRTFIVLEKRKKDFT